MAQTKITALLLPLLALAMPLQAQNSDELSSSNPSYEMLIKQALSPATQAQMDARHNTPAGTYVWGRYVMDGHRTSGALSPTAKKEAALIQSLAPAMKDYAKVIGYSPEAMTKYAPESPLSNWYADVLMVEGAALTGERVDVAIGNFGGIRVDMPKGDVTVDDIRSMFPFKNYLTQVKMTGRQLWDLFAWMARTQWQVVGGVHVEAEGQELRSVKVGGEPIEMDKVYNIMTINFLLTGGDGFYLAKDAVSHKVYDIDQFTAIMRYIDGLRAQNKPIQAGCDGRITVRGDKSSMAKPVKGASKRPLQVVPADMSKKARLTILHTNDTHSHLQKISSGTYAGTSGLVERAAFVDSVRRADGARNVLLLDAGDFCQGTTYFSVFKGKPELKGLDIMKYDAGTLGNHEWDNGVEALAGLLPQSKHPIVLCNYETANKKLKKLIKPYTIVKRGGMKIGITGILVDVSSSVDADVAAQIKYLDPVQQVNKVAAELRQKGCDMVIVLSHCGFSAKVSEPVGDIQIAGGLRGVDMIIGGHTHTDLLQPVYLRAADGNDVLVTTDYCWGIYVGQLKLF